MIVATNGAEEYRVVVVHWWPGRRYRSWHMAEIAGHAERKKGTRYATVAFVDTLDIDACGVSLCCPKDQPSREYGRDLATVRLEESLAPLGYWLEYQGRKARDE